MPDIQLVSSTPTIAEDDDENITDPSGALRLLPVVAFGLGAAALAGLIILGSAAGTGASGYLTGAFDITCCPSI